MQFPFLNCQPSAARLSSQGEACSLPESASMAATLGTLRRGGIRPARSCRKAVSPGNLTLAIVVTKNLLDGVLARPSNCNRIKATAVVDELQRCNSSPAGLHLQEAVGALSAACQTRPRRCSSLSTLDITYSMSINCSTLVFEYCFDIC